MRLRALRLHVETSNGPFGALLRFDRGLVLIRADNSSGKSTCVQGVIYALGLEGMLSASHDVPLAHAMTDTIFDPRVGYEIAVAESYVALEIENSEGEVLTTRRYAKHPTISKDLVSVWDHPALTEEAGLPTQDFFVRRPGAAQREAGFHHRLAEFIGWDLPQVPTFDETARPLYLETLFPLFVVEQKRGWSGIQAQVPMQYRIRDVRRRALEFVLHLSSAAVAAQIEDLQRQSALISQEWRERRAELDAEVRLAGAVVSNVPPRPPSAWPPDPGPLITVPVGASEWHELSAAIDAARAELLNLESSAPLNASDARIAEKQELTATEAGIRSLVAVAGRESDELAMAESELEATVARLDEVEVDLRRHQDLRVLRQMGGTSEASGLLPHDCPTCHQQLPQTVLDETTQPTTMTLDESIRFIEQERALFKDLELDIRRTVEAKRARLNALRTSATEARDRIVALRNSLTEPDQAPSEAQIEARIVARSRFRRLNTLAAEFETHVNEFERLYADWAAVQSALAALRSQLSEDSDEPKRLHLESSLRDQLDAYLFSSLPVGSLSISTDTWRPVHEGFDLGFDLSASDMIRLIWAYLLSLLELARDFDLHHLGLVLFDEPRQQMASTESFGAFIKRASGALEFNQQVVIATSEERGALEEMLGDTPAQVIDFGDAKVLSPET